MTLKDLRNYRAITAELNRRVVSLQKDKRHVVDMVQSAADFPYWLHGVTVEGDVYDSAPRDVKATQNRILALAAIKAEIERWVNSIDDYRIRQIAQLYYLAPLHGDKVTWEDVADAMGDGSTGDACRMAFLRYWREKK